MNTPQYLDLDINAKLPIIIVDSIVDEPVLQDVNTLQLPKPSFRFAQNAAYKNRTHTLKKSRSRTPFKDSYYHYEEPTNEDLMNRVEYDMDEADTKWLNDLNDKFQEKYNYTITDNDFEKIMDRLEKESYFESKKSGKETLPPVDEDATCAICDDGDCANANVILFCDLCNLAVHQECYGVPYVPEGQWLCRRCLQSPSRNVDCVLCPNKGGAFKQTSDNRWCHVICALWIPEVCFANTVFLEPIDNVDQIPSARWKLQCYICRQKKNGACIQCHKSTCYVPFHVTCARQAGLTMKIQTHNYNTPEGPMKDVIKIAYCHQHGPTAKGQRGSMYPSDDSDTDVDDPSYAAWKQTQRQNMKKTRKILAEKRQIAFNPTSEPAIDMKKLREICELLTIKGPNRRVSKSPEALNQNEKLRDEFVSNIYGYWILKRTARNGVPLLRRLQVSYNALAKPNNSIPDVDPSRYESMRYNLEKARLLIGLVKRRETMKKKLLNLSREIIEKRFDSIDRDNKVST